MPLQIPLIHKACWNTLESPTQHKIEFNSLKQINYRIVFTTALFLFFFCFLFYFCYDLNHTLLAFWVLFPHSTLILIFVVFCTFISQSTQFSTIFSILVCGSWQYLRANSHSGFSLTMTSSNTLQRRIGDCDVHGVEYLVKIFMTLIIIIIVITHNSVSMIGDCDVHGVQYLVKIFMTLIIIIIVITHNSVSMMIVQTW